MSMSGIGIGFSMGFGFFEPVKENKAPKAKKPAELPKNHEQSGYQVCDAKDKTLGGFFSPNAVFLSSSPKK